MMTNRLHVPGRYHWHYAVMNHQPHIEPLVAAYIPDAPEAEQIALSEELRALCAALYESFVESERFDSSAAGMVDSGSSNITNL